MNLSICILILLLSVTKVQNQSMNSGDNENNEWRSGYHPFPEMSRFLNSNSRIHYQSFKKTSASQTSYPLREYICSIANDHHRIEEILLIFGENYRSLIKQIIKHDCLHKKRNKRMTININKKNI